ncbi:2-dehydropantoate 2-reductase N-terminal domain-containing protein [Lentzea sp. BCCO 10_0798]|uniref:2-dehydropantoate 2-reductase N-terminal domain-containing protein n=1 Tax=Lentzea kristufekii TaxID=3095430 RepID=A0ABU4TZW2_9PSEU|nr:2-dehydropantoate 2-reductase N-terminal domain-containing protein [Lentzea sp. BCCO 10_0798]MDX8053860.1 2-dehydropantoate 2-reductase N-terminal domain-containing protein [Lentzea sp. BCCO 10_0798]
MKILMFGRGVIATVYGWALEQAGHDVEFYVRPGRAAAYGDTTSLDLLDIRRRPWGQRVVREWPARLREELAPDHDFDLIVLSVGHHRLTEAADFLTPRVGKATVLVFGNIWAEPLDAIGALPAEQVAWGFPQAGGGFGENGVLRGAVLPSVLFGTVGPQTERGRVVRRVFREAGFRIKEEPDFRGWLLLHFVSDAGLFSQGLRLGALADLAGRRHDLREALLAGRELLPLVEARGVVVGRRALLFRAPTWLTAPLFAWLTAHFGPVRDNFATHSDPEAEEPRVICRDVLADARRLGVAAPRLAAAEPSFAAPVQ